MVREIESIPSDPLSAIRCEHALRQYRSHSMRHANWPLHLAPYHEWGCTLFCFSTNKNNITICSTVVDAPWNSSQPLAQIKSNASYGTRCSSVLEIRPRWRWRKRRLASPLDATTRSSALFRDRRTDLESLCQNEEDYYNYNYNYTRDYRLSSCSFRASSPKITMRGVGADRRGFSRSSQPEYPANGSTRCAKQSSW